MINDVLANSDYHGIRQAFSFFKNNISNILALFMLDWINVFLIINLIYLKGSSNW